MYLFFSFIFFKLTTTYVPVFYFSSSSEGLTLIIRTKATGVQGRRWSFGEKNAENLIETTNANENTFSQNWYGSVVVHIWTGILDSASKKKNVIAHLPYHQWLTLQLHSAATVPNHMECDSDSIYSDNICDLKRKTNVIYSKLVYIYIAFNHTHCNIKIWYENKVTTLQL